MTSVPPECLVDEGGDRLTRGVDLTRCVECGEPSHVLTRWLTSQGPCEVGFCEKHAGAWWKRWGQTPTGGTASFKDVVTRRVHGRDSCGSEMSNRNESMSGRKIEAR